MSGADEISNVGGDCQSSNLANPGAIKFARDYDKEPLIVKDYALHAVFILSSITLVFAFVVYFIFGDYEYSLTACFIFASNIHNVVDFFKFKNRCTVELSGSAVRYKVASKIKKSIPANQIKSVEKVLFLGCDGYEFNAPKNCVRPQIYIYGGIIVALFLIVFGEIMLVLGIVAYLFCSLVTMNLLSNVFVNKNFSFEACDELLIKDRANGFINFVFSKSDRLELKKYFLLKTGQNLDNLQRKPILF